MSKAIKWQIPFVSTIDKIHYRIDIYAEGYTGTPIQLTGGTNPIKTEENKSDDFFAPVRGQTGTIEVVTKLPNGGTLDINDLLPANNIDHPVRLVSISGSTETIEWQGFMSCEAYSQNYTSIPDTFSFPIISVLEAMESVEADPTKLSGLNTIGTTIQKLLEIFIEKAGVSYFDEYYMPTAARGSSIVGKYIDNTTLFDEKEYNNEYITTYIISGSSLSDCLGRIATYMGWCIREKSNALYFMAANETSGYRRTYKHGSLWLTISNITPVTASDISSLQWRGTDHKRSIVQGAKSVEVVAKLEKYVVSFNIPPCPETSLTSYTRRLRTEDEYLYALVCTDDTIYNAICTFNYYFAQLSYTDLFGHGANCTLADVLSRCALNWGLWTNQSGSEIPLQYKYLGAFFAKIRRTTSDPYESGLYISGMYNRTDESTVTTKFDQGNEVVILEGVKDYRFYTGYLIIKATGKLAHNVNNSFPAPGTYGQNGYCDWDDMGENSIGMWIKVGDKYYGPNGGGWSTQYKTTFLRFDKEVIIPIDAELQGKITVGFFGTTVRDYGSKKFDMYDVFITSFDISYANTNYSGKNDRSENHYFRLLGTNFRDEISIDTDLASSLNNQPSPSLIMNDQTTQMTELNYGTTQAPDMRRPEVDLLNRLATYYGAARQRLELVVAHPTDAPLPLLRLNGINDGKVYLPLAESRDWINDTSILTCFETPQS